MKYLNEHPICRMEYFNIFSSVEFICWFRQPIQECEHDKGTSSWENDVNSKISLPPSRDIPSISKIFHSNFYILIFTFYSSLSPFMTVKRIDFGLQLIEFLSIWKFHTLHARELHHFSLLIPSFYIYLDFLIQDWNFNMTKGEWATELFFSERVSSFPMSTQEIKIENQFRQCQHKIYLKFLLPSPLLLLYSAIRNFVILLTSVFYLVELISPPSLVNNICWTEAKLNEITSCVRYECRIIEASEFF